MHLHEGVRAAVTDAHRVRERRLTHILIRPRDRQRSDPARSAGPIEVPVIRGWRTSGRRPRGLRNGLLEWVEPNARRERDFHYLPAVRAIAGEPTVPGTLRVERRRTALGILARHAPVIRPRRIASPSERVERHPVSIPCVCPRTVDTRADISRHVSDRLYLRADDPPSSLGLRPLSPRESQALSVVTRFPGISVAELREALDLSDNHTNELVKRLEVDHVRREHHP